jgi:4-hydroxy-tetrahydrodipicolinate reductase
MDKVKVVLWGLGAMGSGIAKGLLSREGFEIVGAIDRHEDRQGRKLQDIIPGANGNNITISPTADRVLTPGCADLAIVATSSFTPDVFPQLALAAEAGLDVITIAEEMAFPQAQNPQLAEQLNALAKRNGVSILGTGINPGFVLDTLIIAMTGVCLDVQSIKARRVNDLSPFGPTVMNTQGVGTTPEQFAAGVKAGTIVGHVGFIESMQMIASALGWELDEIEQSKQPIISNLRRETPHVTIEPGMVAGCRHVAVGKYRGQTLISLEHPQQVQPEAEQVSTGDYIEIHGVPNLNVSIQPEIPGGIGTMAMALNMIPQVLQAPPGLWTMKDLPLPAAVLADIRQLLRTEATE